jgi:hypothetical protein
MHALRFLLVGIAVAMFTALGWRAAHQPAPSPPVPAAPPPIAAPTDPFESIEATQAVIEKKLLDDADYEPFFASLKDNFAFDYAETLEGFARAARESRAFGSLDFYISEALKNLRHTRGLVAAQAESDLIDRVFVMQAGVMSAMAAKDARLCADYIYGVASDRYYAFAAENRPLIAETALANLAAIVDGQSSRLQRLTPNEDDFQALEDALTQRGLGRVEIEALVDGKAPDPPLSEERMCAAGRAYLESLASLPQEVRIRIEALVVQLMART